MRITLTGRRLALAAVLVLAGAAAPLAWATVAGNGGSTASTAGAASPAQFPSAPRRSAPLPSVSVSPDVATATADNPYQVVRIGSHSGSGSECFQATLPAGDFGLTQVSAFATTDIQALFLRASLRISTGVLPGQFEIPVTPGGARSFDLVIKPNSFASAAVGDIYELLGCMTSSTPQTVAFVFTGQKISGPSAASVSDFSARPRAQGATLHWTTASESNLLGFHVWRYRNGKGVKVNRTLVRAKRSGEPAGASYRYVDQVRGAKRGLTYRLQLVDLKGKRTWYAAFAIAAK